MKGNKFPLVLMPNISTDIQVKMATALRKELELPPHLGWEFEIRGNSFELTQKTDEPISELVYLELLFNILSDIDIDPASWSFQNLQDAEDGFDITIYILTIHLIQP